MSVAPPSLPQRTIQEQADVSSMLAMLYRDLEKQLARADAKAGLILTANSILLVVSANVVVMYARNAESLVHLLWPALSLVPALLLSGFALNCALSVAYPRSNQIAPEGAPPPSARGWFNPGAIAQMEQGDYVRQFLSAELPELKREALASVHSKSRILGVKFRAARRGIVATVGAFFAWLGVVTVTLMQM